MNQFIPRNRIFQVVCQRYLLAAAVFFLLIPTGVRSQGLNVRERLKGFDEYIEKILKDWNVPGIGVGVVVHDKLVFAKGYGYRDYEKKLPVTPSTLFQIASNTKLFTAVSIGFLVDEKMLDWDKPIRDFVPSIQFYNDELNNTVTIRDMLSHRTGISRHDMIWYKSDFTRKDLFDRLKYLEPSQPIREGFLYNNMMYASSGYIIELLSKKKWEDFVRENIFIPLEMKNSMFSTKDMEKQPDYAVPYNERRDTTLLYRIPFYEEAQGMGPAGSIVSNIEDMSNWLITLMNEGQYKGNQVIPRSVVKATLTPSIALPNSQLENKGYGELLNPVYGMGRWSASYRGHYFTYHGGDIDGFHSQISCMPFDSVGAIVFIIGDHGSPLYNVITYNIYERFLRLNQTPWNERRFEDRIKGKEANKEGRAKSGGDRIPNTKPSHPLPEFTGQYEHKAYGIVNINIKGDNLEFDFHNIKLPLSHYHYDRFDTPNDEQFGVFSINFLTNPQGDIDRAVLSLDESEVTFIRRADPTLSDEKVLEKYTGKYELAGTTVEIVLTDKNLFANIPGQPRYQLIPVKTGRFRLKEFSDFILEFVQENGVVKAMKQIDPSGEYRLEKKK